ncbi:hypothetical protein M758_UG294200 [Ceratodon purpureus]|nr:hypothetical protein M758_UG294200 [Ceratodon purpureus]
MIMGIKLKTFFILLCLASNKLRMRLIICRIRAEVGISTNNNVPVSLWLN